MVALLFYFIGAGLFSFYQVSEIAGLPSKLSVNEIFPHYILNELPIGLTGLLMAAILAAAMSSLDSAMTALSNTIVIDILHSNKTHNDKLILKSAKKWVVIIGLVGTGAAIVASTFDTSLLTMALSVTGLFTGPLLALFILAFYFPHHHPKAVLISAILGMLTLAYFTPPKFLQGIWTPFQSFSWPWFPLIAFISTLIYSMTLHLFYKKNS
jgi:SSS family solute:Na+ symporter